MKIVTEGRRTRLWINPSVESLANPAANDTIELYLCGTAPRVPCIELAHHPSLLFGPKHPSSQIFASTRGNAKRLFFFTTVSNFVPTKWGTKGRFRAGRSNFHPRRCAVHEGLNYLQDITSAWSLDYLPQIWHLLLPTSKGYVCCFAAF